MKKINEKHSIDFENVTNENTDFDFEIQIFKTNFYMEELVFNLEQQQDLTMKSEEARIEDFQIIKDIEKERIEKERIEIERIKKRKRKNEKRKIRKSSIIGKRKN